MSTTVGAKLSWKMDATYSMVQTGWTRTTRSVEDAARVGVEAGSIDGDGNNSVKVDGQLQGGFVFAVGVEWREDSYCGRLVTIFRGA